jgi:hypothetical protein
MRPTPGGRTPRKMVKIINIMDEYHQYRQIITWLYSAENSGLISSDI